MTARPAVALPGWPGAMGAALAAAYVDMAETTLYTLLNEGRFPQPIELSDKRRGWRRTDLDAWIQNGGVAAYRPSAGGPAVPMLAEANPWD